MKIDYKNKTLISGEEQEKREVEFLVEDQKLKFQSDFLEGKRQLARLRTGLEDAKTEYPLDVQKIVNIQLDIESLEDGLKRMEKLQEELGL